MFKKSNQLFLDINTLVFKYKDVSILDFSQMISSTQLEENHTLPLLYFLILKNNASFWQIVKDKIEFNISTGNYIIQMHVLKNFKELEPIFSQNIENSLIISHLNFELPNIKQIFFDFSVLFSTSEKVFFLNKKTDVSSVLWGSNPIEKYNLIKNKLTYKQKKQVFNSSIQYFRVSSVFILNDLFTHQPKFFNKKITFNYLSIFSQCDNAVKQHTLDSLLSINKFLAFKAGINLTYSFFDYQKLIEFFELLSQVNVINFHIMACGFISNPQQLQSHISNYLIKKLSFIGFQNKFSKSPLYIDKIKKI